MIKYYDLKDSEVFIFEDFVINQIKEGVNIIPSHNDELMAILDKHFSNRKSIYISNRVFSYSVDPLTYLETSKIHNLAGIAIVAKSPLARENSKLEGIFYQKKFRVFNSLLDAMNWAREVLQSNGSRMAHK